MRESSTNVFYFKEEFPDLGHANSLSTLQGLILVMTSASHLPQLPCVSSNNACVPPTATADKRVPRAQRNFGVAYRLFRKMLNESSAMRECVSSVIYFKEESPEVVAAATVLLQQYGAGSGDVSDSFITAWQWRAHLSACMHALSDAREVLRGWPVIAVTASIARYCM